MTAQNVNGHGDQVTPCYTSRISFGLKYSGSLVSSQARRAVVRRIARTSSSISSGFSSCGAVWKSG